MYLAIILLCSACSLQEPEGAYSELNPTKDNYAELGALEERNLLEFARQIAAGMVFIIKLSITIIHNDIIIISDVNFRNFSQDQGSFIVILPVATYSLESRRTSKSQTLGCRVTCQRMKCMCPCPMDFFHFDGWLLSPSTQESLQPLQTPGRMVQCYGSFVQCVSMPYFLHYIMITIMKYINFHHCIIRDYFYLVITDAIL